MRTDRLIVMLLVGLSGVASDFHRSAAAQPGPAGQLALVGGTVYATPTDQPIRDGVVLIAAGKITAVGTRSAVRVLAGMQVIDCAGLTITPGFWNSHVHFLQRKWMDAAALSAPELGLQLQEMLTRYGFTSVFDTWSMWENTRRLRDRIESGEVAGPRIRSTGEAIFPKAAASPNPAAQQAAMLASWGALGFIPLDRIPAARVAEAAEARDAAVTLLDGGVDGLKVYAATIGRSGVAMPDEALQAAIKEALSRNKPVFAHPTTAAGLMAAVRAGATVLAHTTPQSGPWDEPVLATAKASRAALIPTLMLWRYEVRHERGSIGNGLEETAVGQLRAWNQAGGVVLFGTDVGYMTDYDPTQEYVLMARAGMNARQILTSLTTAPAERFGASATLGRIAPGFAADLTVLRNDPAGDVRAFAAVHSTIRDGAVIYRAER